MQGQRVACWLNCFSLTPFPSCLFAFVILAGFHSLAILLALVLACNPECFDSIWILGLLLTFVEFQFNKMYAVLPGGMSTSQIAGVRVGYSRLAAR